MPVGESQRPLTDRPILPDAFTGLQIQTSQHPFVESIDMAIEDYHSAVMVLHQLVVVVGHAGSSLGTKLEHRTPLTISRSGKDLTVFEQWRGTIRSSVCRRWIPPAEVSVLGLHGNDGSVSVIDDHSLTAILDDDR